MSKNVFKEENRDNREMTIRTRMNVEASYKREMLQENHINAIVSLIDARWVW